MGMQPPPESLGKVEGAKSEAIDGREKKTGPTMLGLESWKQKKTLLG